jgi:hypothetical protein
MKKRAIKALATSNELYEQLLKDTVVLYRLSIWI